MNMVSRTILIFAIILMAAAYVFPMWQISLEAPQYPEGIGMYIWLDNISGQKPHDLNNINGINHYIGMKPILPEDFPELQYMPYIVGFMMIFGLLTAITGKKSWLWAWVVLIVLLGLAGLADFYLWAYDYGHNLNPHAAIKVPGMSYQPPLIGTKTLLNFTAHSWPSTGGWAVMAAGGLGFIAALLSTRWSPFGKKREVAA